MEALRQVLIRRTFDRPSNKADEATPQTREKLVDNQQCLEEAADSYSTSALKRD